MWLIYYLLIGLLWASFANLFGAVNGFKGWIALMICWPIDVIGTLLVLVLGLCTALFMLLGWLLNR
jgi:hypothetical protein